MTTTRETILAVLFARIEATAVSPAPTFERGAELPEKIPANGIIIQQDGPAPLEPIDVVLNTPQILTYAEAVPVIAAYQHKDKETRREKLDAILSALGTALRADPTLGGLVASLQIEMPDFTDDGVLGSASIRAADLRVTLTYDVVGDALA